MAYSTIAKYKTLFGDISAADFERFAWEAARLMEAHTTGVDNVRKLRVAFPTDEYDAECVQRCECELVYLMLQVDKAEKAAACGREYVAREDGSVSGKVVSSVSSGSESVSYATSWAGTAIDEAAKNVVTRNMLYFETIKRYLSGVADANGVNLLYMGVYPCVR